jgi:act minimal PKS chain-length factor (CLF/KS beta)
MTVGATPVRGPAPVVGQAPAGAAPVRGPVPVVGRAPVVSGIGVIAPTGIGVEDYWQATLAGTSGIAPITLFDAASYPVRLAGEVRGFAAKDHIGSRLIVQTDRWTHLGLAATSMALADAGLDPAAMDPYDIGVVTASSSGGNAFGQREIQSLWSKGPEYVTVYQSIGWFYAATTGQVSIRHQLKGPSGVMVAEQAGGLDAVGQARRVLRDDAKAVITGGTEAPIGPYAFTCQLANGMLSRSADPLRAYLPFDAAASGHIPGEGGAVLVLEDPAVARARGATHSYGEIAGYAATFDPPPGSGRPPTLRRAIDAALADAGAAPEEIDVVFADAAGSPELDRAEAAAIAAVLGPHRVPVTAPKSMVGRLYAGGAALDLATSLLALRDQVIPPTTGVRELAPGCEIDLVRDRPRPAALRTALVLARGFGGFNSALVVRRPPAPAGATPTTTAHHDGKEL